MYIYIYYLFIYLFIIYIEREGVIYLYTIYILFSRIFKDWTWKVSYWILSAGVLAHVPNVQTI